jgi:hypothetical protein
MSKTIRLKIYKFEELIPAAQAKAITQFVDTNVDYGWWQFIYEDAANIGLTLTGFDLDRGNYCSGLFTAGTEKCARKIEKEHGPGCETFKTATQYLAERDKVINDAPKDSNGELNSEEVDAALDELDAEFLKSLLEDYRILLSNEYDYLTSEEAIKETIIANDYDFTKDGKRY